LEYGADVTPLTPLADTAKQFSYTAPKAVPSRALPTTKIKPLSKIISD
jgi:hypothetical protein